METVPVATVMVLVGYIAMLFVHIQAFVGPDSPRSLGWFNTTTQEVYTRYRTPITPAGYTFGIWYLIYAWTLGWITYILTTLCRSNSQGLVYLNPPVTSTTFLVSFLASCCSYIWWLFCWDVGSMTKSLMMMATLCLALYECLYLCLKRVYQYLSDFKEYAQSDLWAYRVMVQNGIALYATWATYLTLINLAVSLIYTAGWSNDNATYTCLSILTFVINVFFIGDLFLFDVYSRYVFMVYPAFIYILSGIMVANETYTDGMAFIWSAVLVALAIIYFIVKTVFMIIRDPVYLIVKKAKLYDNFPYTQMV